MINIIAADSQTIVLNGLKTLLEDSEINITHFVSNTAELEMKLTQQRPHLLLLDISTICNDGLDLLTMIRKKYASLRVLIFTTYIEPSIIKKVLKAGINGYILKDIRKGELIQAIKTILQGKHYFDKRISNLIMNSYQSKSNYYRPELTNREKEITTLIANGLSTPEIAQTLFVSPLTVETHRKNIFTKLGINKVTALVRYAVEEGLVY